MIGIGTGIAKISMTQIKNTVVQLMMGNRLSVGFNAALVQLPATLINVVTTIIVVTFLYFPLKKAMVRLLPTNKY